MSDGSCVNEERTSMVLGTAIQVSGGALESGIHIDQLDEEERNFKQ